MTYCDFILVTEMEVDKGILSSIDPDIHSLAFVRTINNISKTQSKVVAKFVDLTGRNSIDSEAQRLLKSLRDEKLPKALGEKNTYR